MDRPLRDFITLNEAARELGLSKPGAFLRVRNGRLEAYRIGNEYLIPRDAVKRDKF